MAMLIARGDGAVLVQPPGEIAPRTIPREAFMDTAFGGQRQLAYDATRRRLWYAADHVRIASIDIDTLAPGPVLDAFSDVALFGCAVAGNPRTFAVDAQRHLLLVSMLQGSVSEYDLDTLELRRAITPTAFDDPALGRFRRIAVDVARGTLWYAITDRRVIEVRLADGRATGRRAPINAEVVGLAVDPGTDQLVFTTADGGVQALTLRTLQPVSAPPLSGEAHSGLAFAAQTRAR